MQLPINLPQSLQTTRWKAILDQTIAQVTDLQDQLKNINGSTTPSSVPTGSVVVFAGSSAPDGWLFCDGSTYDSVANTQYAALFTAIGTTYGGTGASSFNVPDCRGIFVRGVGSQTISGQTYSGTIGTKQVDNLESHNHGGATGASTVPAQQGSFAVGPGQNTLPGTSVGPVTLTNSSHSHSISSSGTGTETYPANIALNYIIKT
jgi:microcystin-dependent protein